MVLTLAIPPITFAPALLIAIPGLICLIDGAPTARAAAARALVFGIFHHLTGLYWITSAVLIEAADFWWAIPIAVPALAAVLALFIAAPAAISRLAPAGWRRAAVFAGAWVLADIARQFILTGFPWNPLGSAAEMPGLLGLVFMQPAAWVGVGGLTLFTLLLAAAPLYGTRGRLAAVAGLLAWAAAGAWRLALPAGPAPALTAVLVQGNVPEEEHRDHWQDSAWAASIFSRHLALTRQGITEAAGHKSLVIWPEIASPFWLQQSEDARRAVAQAAGGAVTLAGSARLSAPQVGHNSLIAVLPDGSVGGWYDKFHLVPFGEYLPSYLPVMLGEGGGWTPGPGLRTLHIAGLPAIGPLICYEAIFPAQVVLESDRPTMLVNVTNDSWFGNSAGPRQHFAAARMRAVEEGLPILRAANTGISAVINSHGKVVARLGLGVQGVLVAPVPGDLPPTLFARLGLPAPALLAIVSCAAGLGFRRRRPFLLFMA
jgi:apolipoprotein N-acyltransferase